MINLRKLIVQELKKYHDRVYFNHANKGSLFPHIVYSFPNSFTEGEQEIFNLDVDIWDDNDNTTELETLASDIWRHFNRLQYIDDEIQVSIYRENRLPPLDESETNLKRRKLIFQLRYFDKRL